MQIELKGTACSAAEPTTWTQDISVASDPEPTAAGKVAVECWNTTAVAGSTSFDNFKATTLTPPPVPVQSHYR